MGNLPPLEVFSFLTDRRFRWLHHLLFWGVYFSDEILILAGINDPLDISWSEHIAHSLALMIGVYLNLYLLIPHLLLRGKLIAYGGGILLTLGLVFGLNEIILLFVPGCETCPEGESYSLITVFFIQSLDYIFLLGTTTGLKVMKVWLQDRERIQSLEAEKMATELEYLKAQMNPHFLFNALNNIYVLSRTQPEQGSETLLQLSDLLRYQLYDCAQEKVPLKKELEYLRNYLELDRIRKAEAKVEFEVEGDPRGKMVAPLLFLPLVENAVKHGNTGEPGAWIKVRFVVEKDKIIFHLSNSTFPDGKKPILSEATPGGIGLPNVSRRLELLYPKKHQFESKSLSGEYQVLVVLHD